MSTQQSTDGTDTQPTLATFGTGTTAEPDDSDDSRPARPDELEPDADAKQTAITGQFTLEDLEHHYESGKFPTEIAGELADLSREQVADRLRRAGVLEPQDDRRALAFLYHDHDRSTVQIAEGACDGTVTSETIAYRLHLFGLANGSTRDLLADPEIGPEDIGLESTNDATSSGPETDVVFAALLGAANAHETDVRELTIPDYEHYAASVSGTPDVETIVDAFDGWNAAKRAAARARDGPTTDAAADKQGGQA